MNKNKLKSYAIAARREFIKAVTERAQALGVSERQIEPAERRGDLVFIAGRPFRPEELAGRDELVGKVRREGFAPVIQSAAYTWFNRFAALRFMELHGYLEHGKRVLSAPDGTAEPEILQRAAEVELLYLDRAKTIELKLAGNRDDELYRSLILCQCWDLAQVMPFLFSKKNLEDYVDILLPDNLLRSDSLVRGLVEAIPAEDWAQVEIIGWLYQFFISEEKSRVDELVKKGKKVEKKDIPAKTQLFTPNWIVQYMTQNSLGRLWLETYPDSGLKGKMPYYIEPAAQEPAVEVQLASIRPKELNPEALTVLDPACGSGHILVEAFSLLFEIYRERGYRRQEIPRIILEKNLYGLDIDRRAAQLAGFALLMKAREHDREIFSRPVTIHVLEIIESNEVDRDDLDLGGLSRFDINELLDAFRDAKTYGSLIRIEPYLLAKLGDVREKLATQAASEDLHKKRSSLVLQHFYDQAAVLARQYDAVIANPPYLGGKSLTPALKDFAKNQFRRSKSDLFAMFIERGLELCQKHRFLGMVTMQSWMFLSSYEEMRENLLNAAAIQSMVHMTNGVMGIAFGTAATVWRKSALANLIGSYSYVTFADLTELDVPREFPIRNERLKDTKQGDFRKIPGSPIAYWINRVVLDLFVQNKNLADISKPRQGATTSDNDRFLRLWSEVSHEKIGIGHASLDAASTSNHKWFPYNKGGNFRRWYGNQDYVINYENDGKIIKIFHEELNKSRPGGRLKNQNYYFKPCVSWSKISSGVFAVRYFPEGFIFDVAGSAVFFNDRFSNLFFSGMLNTSYVRYVLAAISPTLNYEAEHLCKIPVALSGNIKSQVVSVVEQLVEGSKKDWDAYETSWDFTILPLLNPNYYQPTLNSTHQKLRAHWREITLEMQRLEEENNRLFIDAYGLQDELTPDVPLEQITLTCNPFYRYKFNTETADSDENGTEDPDGEAWNASVTDSSSPALDSAAEAALWDRFRTDTMKELLSYAVGCMMGRYSLDRPGLIYAHAGNEGFDPAAYTTFPADDDGIVPVCDLDWFDDDAAARLRQFIRVAWPAQHLDANLAFITAALGGNPEQTSEEMIRRYFSRDFYADHCRTYRKRPIYWLFSSGKQKAFECLVYLHRYNGQTLSRMRSTYVQPLHNKIAARLGHLQYEIDQTTLASQRNRLERERALMQKKMKELLEFDEKLRHYADQRITLDLDDGVKVNYQKFGDLLAKIK